MRKLIVVFFAFIPLLMGCEPKVEEFYGIRFVQNGKEFELPPSSVSYTSLSNFRFNYPPTDTALAEVSSIPFALYCTFCDPGIYTYNNFTFPYYNQPADVDVANIIESKAVLNIKIMDYTELEAEFFCRNVYKSLTDSNITYTNTITNGYVHKKN